MNHYLHTLGRCVVVLMIILSFSGCRSRNDYFLVGQSEQRVELSRLFEMLEAPDASYESRVVLIEQITGELYNAGYPQRMQVFLSRYIEDNPDDPYIAYYLLLLAQHYASEGATPVATQYYARIVAAYPDLVVRERSVHYRALSELVSLTPNEEDRIEYYQDLITRFPDQVDLGQIYYHLGQSYQELGRWDEAFSTYEQFLAHTNTQIPGKPDAHRETQTLVNLYNSERDWTMESIDDLVAAIKHAIWIQSPNRLLRYRSADSFFAMSWEQEEWDFNSQISFDIGAFLLRSRVRFADELDVSSNVREAYLRTWNWSYRINTWYLYFRRIDFPADPEIHNNWEWAGIYFGEAL
ncbi:MAG: tetratricopeptide repeat protein [Spirochaetia bacterium]